MGGTSKKAKTKKGKASKAAPAKAKAKAKARGRELGDDELEKVAGGAGYVKLGTLGEVRADKHKEQIEIDSFSWGVAPLSKELTLRKK